MNISKNEDFDAWVNSIESRIEVLRNELNDNLSAQLNYTQTSLSILEKFVLESYTFDSIQNKNKYQELDRIVSYIGESIKKIFSDSKWIIYLEDETNIYFGLPCVLTKYSGAICIHHLLREILTKKSGEVLKNRVQKGINYEKVILNALKDR